MHGEDDRGGAAAQEPPGFVPRVLGRVGAADAVIFEADGAATLGDCAGTTVDVNDEGFLTEPTQWNEDVGRAIAAEEGIDELTDRHWVVINFMRDQYFEKGTGPTVRILGKTSGVSVKELYQLFPKGPAKVAAKVAGIPKPRGCI